MALSKESEGILAAAVVVGSWHLTADTIVHVAELISAGYLRADDDYEGPRLYPTERGTAAALRRKIVCKSHEASYQEFTYPHPRKETATNAKTAATRR